MIDRFYIVVLILLSVAFGYSIASRRAEAGNGSVGESVSRMADSLERIEQLLTKRDGKL